MPKIKYCPHCQQNVVVSNKPTTKALVLCFLGFPFLVGANSMNTPRYIYNPQIAFATLVLLIVFFQVLVAIGWIVGIVGFMFRRSYCPICKTPSKMLQPQK